MSLQSMLYDVPLYRTSCLPQQEIDIVILCSNDDIKHINTVFSNYKIKLVISAKQKSKSTFYDNIQIDFDLQQILNLQNCSIIIFDTMQNIPLLLYFLEKLSKSATIA